MKEKLEQEVYLSSKQTQDSKILVTLLVLLDYFLCLRFKLSNISENCSVNCQFMLSSLSQEKFNKEEFKNSEEEDKEIDCILAGCIYFLLSFSWGIYKDVSKILGKNNKPNENILIYLLSKFKQAQGPIQIRKIFNIIYVIEHFLLTYIFNENERGNKEYLGHACYSALFSVIIGIPYQFETIAMERAQLIQKAIRFSANDKLFKNNSVLIQVLSRFSSFTIAAKSEFLNEFAVLEKDSKFYSELQEEKLLYCFARCLLDCPSENPNLGKSYAQLLNFLCSKKNAKFEEVYFFFSLILTAPISGLAILSEFLDVLYQQNTNLMEKPFWLLIYLEVAYLLEDILILQPCIYLYPSLLTTICRLLVRLDQTNMLYFSLPILCYFDERCKMYHAPDLPQQQDNSQIGNKPAFTDVNKLKESHFVFREGGFVRIILNILLLAIKHDLTCTSVMILKFYIFRDRGSKQTVKKCANFLKKTSGTKSQVLNTKYNIIDLSLKHDQGILKVHAGIIEMAIKKGLSCTPTLLSAFKTSSKNLTLGNSIFENYGFLMFYLTTELIHLIHFYMLNISSYEETPSQEKRDSIYKKLHEVNDIPEKGQILIELFSNITHSTISGERDSDEYLRMRYKEMKEFSIKIPAPTNAEVMYSSLDEKSIEKRFAASKNVESPEKKNQPLESYMDAWFNMLEGLIIVLRQCKTTYEKCIKLNEVILIDMYIGVIQRYQLYCTASNFRVIDNIIYQRCILESNKYQAISYDSVVREHNKVNLKILKEYHEVLYHEFASLTYAKEKIGILFQINEF